MEIFHVSKGFPANIREAWAKRRYEAHFVSKLSDSDGENRETDMWLDFAHNCEYLSESDHTRLTALCSEVGAMLGSMMNDPSSFIVWSASDL
jgi:four helix bundle protein